MNSQIVSFQGLVKNAVHVTEICDLSFHNHKSRKLELYALDYREHHISLVKDADCFDIQIDHDDSTTRRGLSWSQVEDYVESLTPNRCQIDL